MKYEIIEREYGGGEYEFVKNLPQYNYVQLKLENGQYLSIRCNEPIDDDLIRDEIKKTFKV